MPICSRTNHPISDNAYVTLYEEGKPDRYECLAHAHERYLREYAQSKLLTTQLLQLASLEKYRPMPILNQRALLEISQASVLIQAAIKTWEATVWFGGDQPWLDSKRVENNGHFISYKKVNGKIPTDALPPNSLQAFVIPAPWKGYQAQVGTLLYRSYTICGRSLFQIEEGDYFLSICCDETSPQPRSGLQGIQATLPDALRFLERAVADWKGGVIRLEHEEQGLL